MADYIEADPPTGSSQATGIHIEGPFLSHDKRGMHSAEHLLLPSSQLLDQFWQASRGNIRLMTIAPELPGALETIEHASALGIRSSMGHSMAIQAEAIAGRKSGVVSATPFNAMRPFDHRGRASASRSRSRRSVCRPDLRWISVAPEAVAPQFEGEGGQSAQS
jgi:N-acetylglucosamine-6-phosphate deacetylase